MSDWVHGQECKEIRKREILDRDMNQRPYTIQTIRSADILLDMLTYTDVCMYIHIDTHI
jgi:hypothetical protein